MRKMSSKKNTKKTGKNVFKILFYFSKMDKNKCPKLFLKKKFQKTGIFYFFLFACFDKNYQNIPENHNSCFKTSQIYIFRCCLFYINSLKKYF